MAYSPPPGNITSSVDLFSWINSTVNNWFFPGVIVAIYFIIIIKLMFKTDDLGKSFASASFACMILTILLRVINLVNTGFMVIFIIATAISVAWMHFENLK